MQNTTDLTAKITAALIGLVKQIKALRYYPPNHPALQTAAEESLKGFRPVLKDHPLCLVVRKDLFLHDEQPLGRTWQILGQLAMFCFARRIQYLTILPDLTTSDLHRFLSCLLRTPQEIVAQGGIQKVLERERITTIWVNEQDLSIILARKQQLEQLPPDTDPNNLDTIDQARSLTQEQLQAQELEKLLKLLEQAHDDLRFRYLLQELVPLLRLNLSVENRILVLRAMALLCRNATNRKASEVRQTYALNAIGQLTTDELTDYLSACLLSFEMSDKARKLLVNVLVFLGDKVVRRLMHLLTEETLAANRKILVDVVVRIGAPAFPVLQEHLFDERWYVVRNAILILGKLRNDESVIHLEPMLEHRDHRVRRETIQALTRIGGQCAVNALLHAAEASDQEMRRQALLSLGAIRASSAVPTLLKLLAQSDWSQRNIDIKKDAIRALGEIRASEAVGPLARILGKRRFWRRSLHDELRVLAATALGEIGEEGGRAALEYAIEDRSAPVSRAAAQALMQMEKDL